MADLWEPETEVPRLRSAHRNIRFTPTRYFQLRNAFTRGPAPFQGRSAIRAILKHLDREDPDAPIRALGSKWSLSDIARQPEGWLVGTGGLQDMRETFPPGWLHKDCPFEGVDLCWAQCGTRIQKINARLAGVGRSLATSGASNGQTIAGATATGTHGSTFAIGSMSELLLGMHLVQSGSRHMWLAPSVRTLSDKSIRALCGPDVTIVHRNDWFDTARVHVGAFGLVSSVLLKTEPLFLMRGTRDDDHAWGPRLRDELLSLADPTTAPCDADGHPLRHLGMTFDPNPHSDHHRRPWVTRLYEKPAPPGTTYSEADLNIGNAIIVDPASIHWLSAVQALGGGLATHIAANTGTGLLESQNDRPLPDTWHPHGTWFREWVFDAPGTSMEIGVPLNHASFAIETALDLLERRHRDNAPFLGSLAVRLVGQSRAPLSVNRFGPTCTLEFPGGDVPWAQETFRQILAALGPDSADIPLAQHWGQRGDFSRPFVERTIGVDALQAWKEARNAVVGPFAARFGNPMLRSAGLVD